MLNEINIISIQGGSFKNKKVMLLSLITNVKGIPLNIALFEGNCNDINIFNKQLNKLNLKLINKKSTIFIG
jgi:transposase